MEPKGVQSAETSWMHLEPDLRESSWPAGSFAVLGVVGRVEVGTSGGGVNPLMDRPELPTLAVLATQPLQCKAEGGPFSVVPSLLLCSECSLPTSFPQQRVKQPPASDTYWTVCFRLVLVWSLGTGTLFCGFKGKSKPLSSPIVYFQRTTCVP